MEHHTFFKILRVVLAGLSLNQLCSESHAMDIHGLERTTMSDHHIDFALGKRTPKDDDEYDCEEEEETYDGKCLDVKPSAWTLSNMYRDQPLYMNFRPRTEEAMLIDNMCFTFFPLPDDQFTYIMYTSTVYRDGSNLIESDIVTDVQLGIFRAASPYCTYKEHVLGYAGCDTFVMYRCFTSNDCRNKNSLFTFGLSQSCKQISISCLQKIEDIIQGNGIPEQDYVALPMKLPTECVFEPMCTFKGGFANEVGLNMGYNFNHHVGDSPIEIIEVIEDEYCDDPPYVEPSYFYYPPMPHTYYAPYYHPFGHAYY